MSVKQNVSVYANYMFVVFSDTETSFWCRCFLFSSSAVLANKIIMYRINGEISMLRNVGLGLDRSLGLQLVIVSHPPIKMIALWLLTMWLMVLKSLMSSPLQ